MSRIFVQIIAQYTHFALSYIFTPAGLPVIRKPTTIRHFFVPEYSQLLRFIHSLLSHIFVRSANIEYD